MKRSPLKQMMNSKYRGKRTPACTNSDTLHRSGSWFYTNSPSQHLHLRAGLLFMPILETLLCSYISSRSVSSCSRVLEVIIIYYSPGASGELLVRGQTVTLPRLQGYFLQFRSAQGGSFNTLSVAVSAMNSDVSTPRGNLLLQGLYIPPPLIATRIGWISMPAPDLSIKVFNFLLLSTMMYCKQTNEQLLNQLKQGFKAAFHYKDEAFDDLFTSFDSDRVKYRITAKQDKLVFSFACEDFDTIWDYINNYFHQRFYPDIKVTVPGEAGFSCSVSVDQNTLKSINEQQLITRLSQFKRQFFASPYEMMMRAVKEKKSIPNISFKPRPGDKTWIAFDKNQFTVYYGISFTEKSEQTFAKVLLTELMDAKKHVNNSPAVMVTQSELPQTLIQSFPKERTEKYQFTNGITSFTFFDTTITNLEAQADMMGNFRQYVTYHVQASKCSLHAKIIKRIELFYNSLALARIKIEQAK